MRSSIFAALAFGGFLLFASGSAQAGCATVVDQGLKLCCPGGGQYYQPTSGCAGSQQCLWCALSFGQCCGSGYQVANYCTTSQCRSFCDNGNCGTFVDPNNAKLEFPDELMLNASVILLPSCSGEFVTVDSSYWVSMLAAKQRRMRLLAAQSKSANNTLLDEKPSDAKASAR